MHPPSFAYLPFNSNHWLLLSLSGTLGLHLAKLTDNIQYVVLRNYLGALYSVEFEV